MKLAVAVALGLLAGPMAANAVPFAFDCISNNNATNCSIGEAQLSVDVTDAGGGKTLFVFSNSGPSDSAIADVYFDWLNAGAALTKDSITNSAGVAFSWEATPPDLPAGNNANPDFSANLSADSDTPVAQKGVNPGEWVGFTFINSYASVLSSLNSGDLRFGIHVQAFANQGSESFVSTPPRVNVPEPGVIAAFGLGLVGLGLSRRRRRSI